MDFKSIIHKLEERLKGELPGFSSWKEMGARLWEKDYFPPSNTKLYKNASVLLCLILEKDRIFIPFIQRPKEKGPHSNQIGLPGGSFEPDDFDLLNTALRETNEEIGIEKEKIQVIGKLTPLYIPVSKYLVHPYVGFIEKIPEFKINTKEVEVLLLLTLDDFLNPHNKKRKWITIHTNLIPFKMYVPIFEIHQHIIWGATAMILNEFITIYKEIT